MNKKHVQFNLPQFYASLSVQKRKYLEWGRGTGKTTYLGYHCLQLVKQMPRASFAMVGSTYSQILSRFLPAIKEGLALFGVYENIDYVVGSMAGKKMGYKLPFQSPDVFNNIIHFSNGSIFQLVSLDHKDSGRGLNTYAIIGDEAALFDPEKLNINVRNTNRSVKSEFKKSKLLNSELFTSSTPLTQKGKWFIEMEEKAKEKPDEIYFLKATAKQNLDNLRPDYFAYMKDSYLSDLVYNAEMLNIRPKEITDGFYAQLNPDIHYYTDYDNGYLEGLTSIQLKNLDGTSFSCKQDRDLYVSQPLIISLDWGASINCLTVSQKQDDTYRVVKEFYVTTPKLFSHLLLEQFIPYYQSYPTRVLKFYYDRTGNNAVANSKLTFAEEARDILKQNNWKVHMMTTGNNPDHMDKFMLINSMLRDDGRKRLPKIRINESNCPNLIVSLENAEAMEGRQGLEKDKRSERRKTVEQQHATHLSDTFDYPIFALFWESFNNSSRSHEDMPNNNLIGM